MFIMLYYIVLYCVTLYYIILYYSILMSIITTFDVEPESVLGILDYISNMYPYWLKVQITIFYNCIAALVREYGTLR